MRKKFLDNNESVEPVFEPEWMDIEQIASVELTSEDPSYPIELALSRGNVGEWRASGSGEQIIRLIFDYTRRIRRMRLKFVEARLRRTQQFEIAYTVGKALELQHLVRQQWNFDPENSSNTEIENYDCSIDDVSMLELRINPDIGGGTARASLQEWKIAE